MPTPRTPLRSPLGPRSRALRGASALLVAILCLGALLPRLAAGPGDTAARAPLATATADPDSADLRFAFWNLENLFDTQDDPRNPGDDEFLPGTGWDDARYARKLDRLAGVIALLDPHILGVCEIENRRVLEDLLRDPRLAAKEYRIEHVDSPDRRGIDLALLHRGPFELAARERAVHLHPIALPEGKGPTRGILEVNLILAHHPLTVLVHHWPSRSGGAEESVPLRIAAAETARRIVTARLDEERGDGREADILLIGDFNDDPFDPSIAKHLNAVRGRFALEGDRGRTRLHNPSWAFLGAPDRGTIYYEAGWNVFDQAIISRGLLRDPAGFQYVEGSLAIHDADAVRNGNHPGRPPRWFRKYRDDWDEGYSDHFAIHGRLRVAAPGD